MKELIIEIVIDSLLCVLIVKAFIELSAAI